MELNLYFGEDIFYVDTAELTFKATAKGPSHSVTNIDTDGKIERGNNTLQFFSHQPLWLDASVICRAYIQSQLGRQF